MQQSQVPTNTFVLVSRDTGDIWGVFTDTQLLFAMYKNLTLLDQTLHLTVKEYMCNTNLVVSETSEPEHVNSKYNPSAPDKGGSDDDQTLSVPPPLRNEFTKLQCRFNEFKQNFNVFKQLLNEGVIHLNSPKEDVPFIFRDKVDIFVDIIKMDMNEDDAFGYLMDRFYYRPPVYDVDD
jgi:hypothetical protein